MASSTRVLQRMDQNVEALCHAFAACVAKAITQEPFTGPSKYFYLKTLTLRRGHRTFTTLVEDDAYFDAAYATLTAWGMHRMGPNNTKLVDLDVLRTSVRDHVEALDALAGLTITQIPAGEHADMVRRLWSLVAELQVSKAEARIVANSKLLHYLLPELVPPIDREYTFQFFYGRNMLSIPEDVAFGEILMRLLHIADTNRKDIDLTPRDGWNTTAAKIIDNAIVGYVLAQQGGEALQGKIERT